MSSQDHSQTIHIPCDHCQNDQFQFLFSKESAQGEKFSIVRCQKCDLVQVNPQPTLDAVASYYESHYFTKRSDRGYDNYFSNELKKQINLVYDMNLNDLDFYEYEKKLKKQNKTMKALDVGCAAGYFVEFLNTRGWQSSGIELSQDAAKFGIQKLDLDIIVDDFLVCKSLEPGSFEFLSFWASIEHMHSPRRVIERCHELLAPGGHLILSTCRWGLLSRMQGVSWRYMNVPEHLYFFSITGISELLESIGFEVIKKITYGSGLTSKKNSGLFYKISKKIADPLVKLTGQGDMMAFHLVRI